MGNGVKRLPALNRGRAGKGMKKNSVRKRILSFVMLAVLLMNTNTAWAAGDESAENPAKKQENAVTAVSLGVDHSGAVTKDGSLYMWGDNWKGQVGNGTREDQAEPVKVLDHVVSVSLFDWYSGAITEDGSLYMWGDNCYGQIGNGTTENQHSPVKVLDNVVSVSLGTKNTGAVTKDGSLYMWGHNWEGQVGNGTTEDQHSPVKILDHVVSVSVGSNGFSGAITEDGSLYMWGWNGGGQVGDGTTENRHSPVKILDNVASATIGNHSGAITKDGSLYMWGYNLYGAVGNGTPGGRQISPVKVLDNVASISLGWEHSGAVTKDGSLYMWGWNKDGRVGNGTTEVQYHPVKVLDNIMSVSLGGLHSGAVTRDGSLYMWGYNFGGLLGNGTTENQHSPIKVLDNVASASLSSDHSGAVTKDGSLYMWGNNWKGKTGIGVSGGNQLTPARVLENVMLEGNVPSRDNDTPDNDTPANDLPADDKTDAAVTNTNTLFQPYIYRADYYLNNASFVNVTENNFFSEISPCRIISDAGKESGLDLSVKSWDILTAILDTADKPSSLADAVFEKKDIYTALIFSIMECSADEDAVKAMNTKSLRTANKLYGMIKDAMKADYAIDLEKKGGDLSALSTKEQEKLDDNISEILKKDLGIRGEMMDVIGSGLKVIKYLNTLEEWCTYIGNCIMLNDLNESTKEILDEMYAQMPSSSSVSLKAALYDCKTIANDNALNLTADLTSYIAGEMSKDAGQEIVDLFWSGMKEAAVKKNPYVAAIWLAYNGSKLISNTVFKADAIAEKYCKMQALLEIREIAKNVYSIKKDAYQKDKTESRAKTLMAAIDVMFQCMEEDCDSASAFIETVDDVFFEKIKIDFQNSSLNIGKKTYANGPALLESISNIKKSIETQKCTVTLAWIHGLMEDYPDEYEAYKYLLYSDVSEASIELSADAYVYDGTAKKPSVTVYYAESTLTPGTDYEVSYSNAEGIGDAAVTVTGTGKYHGKQTVEYKINLRTVDITSLKAKKAGFTVTWSASQAAYDGCQIRYAKRPSMDGAKSVKVKNGTAYPSQTMNKLASRQTYYVQIRNYKTLGGKNYYSEWSTRKSVKTK